MKFIHRLLAVVTHNFWAMCPRCKKKFGGHQAYERNVWENRGKYRKHYRFVCPSCSAEIKKQKPD